MGRRFPALVSIAVAAFTVLPPLPGTAQVQSITELAEHAAVRRAFRAIDELEATTIADHVVLTEIAAPPFMEDRRAARFALLLREAGADSVWIAAKVENLGTGHALPSGPTMERQLWIELTVTDDRQAVVFRAVRPW